MDSRRHELEFGFQRGDCHRGPGAENAFLGPFYNVKLPKRLVYQDRLGTRIGKAEQNRRFAQALGDVPRYSADAALALSLSAEGFPHALRDYGPVGDGAWPEGPHYWSYATKYVLATIECLLSATGSDYG